MSNRVRHTSADLGVGAGVGVFSGAFGVGGGILLVPFLVLARNVPQKQAQATSLVLVAMASTAGAARYAAAGEVAWLAVPVIAVGGLAGALLGSHIVQRSPNAVLQTLFGFVLMAAGIRMLWPTASPVTDITFMPELSVSLSIGYFAAGAAMGVLSALFGIGGGILLVPILVFSFGYDQHLAAGTALAVMLPISLVGAIRLTRPGFTQWDQGALFGAGAIFGALLGASVALALAGSIIQIAFGILMLMVGGHMAFRGFRQPKNTLKNMDSS